MSLFEVYILLMLAILVSRWFTGNQIQSLRKHLDERLDQITTRKGK